MNSQHPWWSECRPAQQRWRVNTKWTVSILDGLNIPVQQWWRVNIKWTVSILDDLNTGLHNNSEEWTESEQSPSWMVWMHLHNNGEEWTASSRTHLFGVGAAKAANVEVILPDGRKVKEVIVHGVQLNHIFEITGATSRLAGYRLVHDPLLGWHKVDESSRPGGFVFPLLRWTWGFFPLFEPFVGQFRLKREFGQWEGRTMQDTDAKWKQKWFSLKSCSNCATRRNSAILPVAPTSMIRLRSK